jgi:hypothetical protein
MGHERRRGSGGQDQGTSSLVKNRSAEGSILSCLRQAGKGEAPENRLAGRSVLHPQVAPNTAVLRRLYDVQPPNLSKMPFVKRGHVASTLQSSCANDQVVETDHFAGNLQL